MQKVVGSNPISRSKEVVMMNSGWKKIGRKPRRATPRSARQGSSKTAGTATSPPPQQQADSPTEAAQRKGKPQLSDGEEVSSLLASTSQEIQQLLEAADDAASKIRQAAQTEAHVDGHASKGDEVSSLAMLTRISEEVQQVLEFADEAAEKIRAEARAEAGQFLDESRRRVEHVTRYQMDQVAACTEQVLAEALAVQQKLEALRSSFDRATAALDTKLVEEKTEIERPENDAIENDTEDLQATLRRPLGRRRQRKFVAPQEEHAGEISEGARLLALRQLMTDEDSGATEARLRDDLGH